MSGGRMQWHEQSLAPAGTPVRAPVLVTGGTGFAGSHMTERLIEAGYRVRVIIRRTSNLRWVPLDRVETVIADVRNPASLPAAVDGVGAVFHFGGLIRARRPTEFFEANARGTENLARAFVTHGSPPYVFVLCSSLAAGGPGRNGRPVREEDPPQPITPYGRSKLEAERLLARVAQEGEGKLAARIVRPPTIYGPRDESVLQYFRWMRRGIIPLPGPRGARVSIIHVRDLVAGSLLVAEKKAAGVFYLSDGEVHAWEDVAREVATLLGRRPVQVRVPGFFVHAAAWMAEAWGNASGRLPVLTRAKARDIRQPLWVCSTERAQKELGFAPRWTLRRGLQETLQWYKDQGWI